MSGQIDPPSPQSTDPSIVPGWMPPHEGQEVTTEGQAQAGAPQPASRPRSRGIRKRWLVLAGIVGLGGFTLFQGWQQEQNYQAGHAAYLTADCATAVGPFRKAADGEPGSKDNDVALKAKAELQECEALLAADDMATQGKHGAAVLAYSDIVTKYTRSPLKDAALAKGQTAIANPPDRVATIELCDALDTLEGQQFISASADELPPLLHACGQAYEAGDAFAEALAAYARFRSEFPEHGLASEVEAAFVRATLAETDASGAGSLPPPQATGAGTGAAGQATVVIQNDAPDRLNMVFSGPDVRVEELEACADCIEFLGNGPDECPDKGPVGEYVVAPGTYEVVVKSGTVGSIIPFRGTWTLEAGEEYFSCFYIVTDQ